MKNIEKIVFLILILVLLVGCSNTYVELENTREELGRVQVHFIDVGQGDASLIRFNGLNMLIDGGPRSSKDQLISYLEEIGIKKIDYIIGTHPHEDHIGGLPEVIRKFQVESVYLPKKLSNTKIFEELLLEIKNNNIQLLEAKKDMMIYNYGGVKIEFLWPDGMYENTNNNSVVTKLSYNDFDVLIMGDAEKEVERNLVDELKSDLKVDILRVGHHGSNTSSTREFIGYTEPYYAVISVGEENKYGHPDEEVTKILNSINTNILRTDLDGNIVFYIGDTIDLKKSGDLSSVGSVENMNYIGNKNTKIYHDKTCSHIPKEENRIILKNREEAEKNGFKPHTSCIK